MALSVCYPSYVHPVQLALHLAGLNSDQVHDTARKVLNDIRFLAEMMTYRWWNSVIFGAIVQGGQMTWLLVNSYVPLQQPSAEGHAGAEL